MNKQVKKLYDQAWAETTDHYATMQKFAELIVKECAGVELDWLSEQDRKSVAEKIKQHFGV